ncbi:MAG: GNAT family N-acetyltransferase [Clostridiales bacterium]|uniref:GNAT family N-acetyltransferase n=1 Tax=Zhenhengia sp. TaxID=2944208 RepID=UPI00290AE0E4|nr:GNAT family N-acetyltransferase [Clostridiales bacterium]
MQAALASEREKVFVALCDEQVVGYIHAENYEVLYYPSMKNLLGFAVLRDYQRKGIGTRLLNAVEEWAKETGAYGVRLNSGKIRRDAHAFYRLRGYDSEKEQIRFIKKLQ